MIRLTECWSLDTAKVQADVTRSVKGSDWRSNLGVTFTPKEDTFVYIGGYDNW